MNLNYAAVARHQKHETYTMHSVKNLKEDNYRALCSRVK